MEPMAPRRTQTLDRSHWDALWAVLERQPGGAAVAYERMRAAMVRYYRARHVLDPEALADRAIDAVAAGVSRTEVKHFVTYSIVCTRRMLWSHMRDVQRHHRLLNEGRYGRELEEVNRPATSPVRDEDQEAAMRWLRLAPAPHRELVVMFFSWPLRERGVRAVEMAKAAGQTRSAVWNRAYRYRAQLLAKVRAG